MHAPAAESGTGVRRRWKVLALLGALAVLLHAGALSGLDWAWPQHELPGPLAAAMQVRALAQSPPAGVAASPVEVPAQVAALPLAVVPEPRTVARPAPAPAAPRPVLAVVEVPGAAPAVEQEPTPAVLLAVAAAPAKAASDVVPASTEEPIPVYRTRLPPAATLRYLMKRGSLQGNGEMLWRPQADRYELTLEGHLAGLTLLTQVSEGGLDTTGIAPRRFTDKRIRRPMTAANFQRDAGKITYSGPQTEYPLHAGAQDRLSWMIQLAGIVEADPSLGVAGAKVVMFVSGTHGDAGVWAFRCSGPEAATGAGGVAAIHFTREPRMPYDTTVEVWLDPKRHHLPVHASLRAGPNDDGLDLRLQDLSMPP